MAHQPTGAEGKIAVSKFNRNVQMKPAVLAVTSPIRSSTEQPTLHTALGAQGWEREAQAELYLLAAGGFLGMEGKFHESATARDARAIELIRQMAVEDFDWVFGFLTWLRAKGNMRTAPIMLAVEAVHARLEAGEHGAVGTRVSVPVEFTAWTPITNRRLIDQVCQRADEPGELLAYWFAKYGVERPGKAPKIPQPIKRGVADAAKRLYNEYSMLKYDTATHSVRFADVLELCHPKPADGKVWQYDLFKHAIDRRHSRDEDIPDSLHMVHWNRLLRADTNPNSWCNPDTLKAAGMTWEDAFSAVGSKVDKAKLWEAMIPSMGYGALLKNLRNFDEAGVSNKVANAVVARLVDETEVLKSRQFPYRFFSAFKHTKSLRWAQALEMALEISLRQIPVLTGRTLILVDRSPSMFPGYYFSTPNKSDISLADQAAVFGSTLALRAQAPTLVEFGGESQEIAVPKGGSVLKMVGEAFGQSNGTDIPSAIKKHYANHDRVVIVTDEQTRPGYLPSNMSGRVVETSIDAYIPLNVPVFVWNMAGYKAGAMNTGHKGRFTLGGLTGDAALQIERLENGINGCWMWEVPDAA
jgi:hypothetical protein